MTLEEIVEKSIPPVIIGIVFSISMLFIKVNTLENKVQELLRVASDYKDRAERTHQKQWQFISDNNKLVIQLQEREKTHLTKEQFYKEVK